MSEVERQVRQSIILLVVEKSTGRHAGFVQSYNMNFESGTAFVACSTDEAYRNTTVALEASARFVDFLFRAYGFRKICVEVAEFQVSEWKPLMSAGLVEEGRFQDHLWLEGRYWDVLRLAVFHDKWIDERHRAFLLLGVQDEVANLLTKTNSASEEP